MPRVVITLGVIPEVMVVARAPDPHNLHHPHFYDFFFYDVVLMVVYAFCGETQSQSLRPVIQVGKHDLSKKRVRQRVCSGAKNYFFFSSPNSEVQQTNERDSSSSSFVLPLNNKTCRQPNTDIADKHCNKQSYRGEVPL